MIIMIDNHDSFTYNIIEYLNIISKSEEIKVMMTEDVSIERIESLNPKLVIISPGPGHPDDYKDLKNVMKHICHDVPILGVCLGFQLLISIFGGRVIKGEKPIHGHVAKLEHDGEGIYLGLPQSFQVTRYHSLIADMQSIPDVFKVSSFIEQGIPMSVRHKELPIEAVQYHPESILSEYGKEQFANFLMKVGIEVESTYSV